ncbi:MAG: lysine-2,3-aminomutase-like protein [Reyranellaceae bacterium]
MTHQRQSLRTLDDLVAAGAVDAAQAQALQPVVERFQVAVTPAMLGLMARDESGGVASGDAIAAQFLPDPREAMVAPEELADPIGDEAHRPLPGLIHRYADRVLLQPTHVCAVYCRFCFRRETVGPENGTLGEEQLAAIYAYIAARPQIFEVILSGGDPLVLSPRRLRAMVEAIAAIEHVKVIRLHTRIPAVDPARLTPELVRALQWRGATYVVLHVNHARELSPAALRACATLVDAGIPMLSQSVLLKGVNDDAATLEELFRTLVAHRIKPYYLHHGDLAQGTGHFRTSIAQGQALMRSLRGRLTGIAQPTYVLDIPGGHGKVPLGPGYVHDCAHGLEIEDPQGQRHSYPPKPQG